MGNDNPLKAIRLLNLATADGAGDFVTWQGSGRAELQIAGTMDGAVITLHVLAPDDATAIPVNDTSGAPASFTGLGTFAIPYIARGQQVRATVASAGASSSVSVWLVDADKAGW
jgi:hypothetical protein